MPGPTPKHPSVRARRNDARKGFRLLGAEDRKIEVPAWPLRPDPTKTAALEAMRDRVASLQGKIATTTDGRTRGRLQRELNRLELETTTLQLILEQGEDAEKALWAELWTYPVAEMWVENKTHRAVALYVRYAIRGEQGDLKAATEARQWSDRLGLSDYALLRLRAEVARTEEAEEQRRRRPRPVAGDATTDPRAHWAKENGTA